MERRAATAGAAVLSALVPLFSARADTPSTLLTHGANADRIAPLGWFALITSMVVVVVTTLLVVIGILRRRAPTRESLVRDGGGQRWIIVGGIVVPSIVLAVTFIFTNITLASVGSPPRAPAMTVEITGHRWWWEIRYRGRTPGEDVITANELHVPVGAPVRLELVSTDVIHSFWVPQLAGKTDVVPGQRNAMWIEARAPGRYYGQCAEYCGVQHARMGLFVFAEAPDEFAAWLSAQRAGAGAPRSTEASEGERVFLREACVGCHTIRGTPAQGRIGPDLTHLASRTTLAAGTIPNTPGDLAGWISNAQGIKRGSLMPRMALRPAELHALLAYLGDLR